MRGVKMMLLTRVVPGVQLDFYGNQRNMTVTAATLGMIWRHRFTGHVQLTQDMLGTETFFHPDFQVRP